VGEPAPPSAGALDDELRRSAAHVFVEPAALSGEATIGLDPIDQRHLGRVLRLRPGEVVTVSDGVGNWRACRWRGTELELAVDGPVRTMAGTAPPISIGFAPVKGDRPEWTVQKLTELGVDVIVPLRTVRSVVIWDGERGSGHLDRLRRVAREAAAQARRCVLPDITDVRAPADVVGMEPGGRVALAEPGGDPVSLERPTILIGPEGGWDPTELTGDPPLVGLGPFILRAETAALTAAALLVSLRCTRKSPCVVEVR
jgi:16S rRNA (uracil1498-N3)-methyltransferase